MPAYCFANSHFVCMQNLSLNIRNVTVPIPSSQYLIKTLLEQKRIFFNRGTFQFTQNTNKAIMLNVNILAIYHCSGFLFTHHQHILPKNK